MVHLKMFGYQDLNLQTLRHNADGLFWHPALCEDFIATLLLGLQAIIFWWVIVLVFSYTAGAVEINHSHT